MIRTSIELAALAADDVIATIAPDGSLLAADDVIAAMAPDGSLFFCCVVHVSSTKAVGILLLRRVY